MYYIAKVGVKRLNWTRINRET